MMSEGSQTQKEYLLYDFIYIKLKTLTYDLRSHDSNLSRRGKG